MSEGGGLFCPGTGSGPDALRDNPALLAGPRRPGFSCRLVELGLGFDNNSFSLSQYNRYNGAWLDAAAKSDILRSIPGSGLRLSAQASASAVEFVWRNFGVSVRTVGSGSCLIPGEVFDLALFGNRLGRRYCAEGALGSAQAHMRAGVAAGTALGRNFALGAGAYYLRGLGRAELQEARGSLVTTPEAIQADGIVSYRRASGGAGAAFDAGAAFWKNGWFVALAGRDIGGRMVWADGAEEGTYAFAVDSANAYDAVTGGLFVQRFEQRSGCAFVTSLPLGLSLAASRSLNRWLSCGALIDCRLFGETALDDRWQGSALAEVLPLKWLHLGLELGYGMPDGALFGFGVGALLRHFRLRTRFEYVGGLVMAARGMRFGLDASYMRLAAEPDVKPFRLRYGVE